MAGFVPENDVRTVGDHRTGKAIEKTKKWVALKIVNEKL